MTALCFFGFGMIAGALLFGEGDGNNVDSAWGRGAYTGLIIMIVALAGGGLGL